MCLTLEPVCFVIIILAHGEDPNTAIFEPLDDGAKIMIYCIAKDNEVCFKVHILLNHTRLSYNLALSSSPVS
jgi:hypothetical protein